MKEEQVKKLVDRFLAWPLPKSVSSDTCVTVPEYQSPRSGTNLLTADEARQMIEHLFANETQREPTLADVYKDPIFATWEAEPKSDNVKKMHYGDLTTVVGAMIRRAFERGQEFPKEIKMNSDNPTFRTPAEERRAEEYIKMTQRVSQLEGELAIEKQTSAYRMHVLKFERQINGTFIETLVAARAALIKIHEFGDTQGVEGALTKINAALSPKEMV